MTVNYKPFANYNTDPQAGGKNIKFNFKATNCYKYDAQVLDCYKAEDRVGLKVDAQTAQLSSYNVPSFKT
jgi:hypothetical protein